LLQASLNRYIQTVTQKIYKVKTVTFFSAWLRFTKIKAGRIKIYDKGMRVHDAEAMLQD
jgi:hypothetical protein